MSTQLFFRVDEAISLYYSTGNNDAKLDGTTSGWEPRSLATTRGPSVNAVDKATVAGPTNGVEAISAGSSLSPPGVWYSQPLDADVTISGSITWNLWSAELNMADNVAINGRLEVVDGATGAITLIDQTARTVEVALTTRGVNNFAETPAAGIACKRGDRLRVRVFADDAGTMGAGGLFSFGYGGPTAAADGDSYLTLTENLTFVSEPAGSQIFPTDSVSDVATASVDREAWTSRGAGVQTDVTNSVNGWTAPVQVTDTAGGTVVDWFTKALTAFTLGGAVRCNIRGTVGAAAGATTSWRCEVAVCNNDGSSPVVWAAATTTNIIAGAESAESFLISGDDVAVTDGQRLRIRLYIDDVPQFAMVTGRPATLFYAGTSGGASGDTYLTFTQTLTEFVAGGVPFYRPYTQLLAQ